MIYLITGMPGNGKTLFAVQFIAKELKKGRKVYSDIKDLKLEGVEPAPEDWRTLPDGALVVYDEAHKRFPSFKGKGRSPLEVVRDMDEHRHRGFDLMMLTQWPDKIDNELFRLVGTHKHLNRAFGLQQANVTTFNRGVMNPYSATSRKGADEEIWTFPQQHYENYASSSLHTDAHKFKLPGKVKMALLSVPVILATLYGFYWFITPKTPDPPRSEAETPGQGFTGAVTAAMPQSTASDDMPATGEYLSLTAPPVVSIAGCVDSSRGCRCWGTDGLQIDQTQAECRSVVDRPLPINIYHNYSRGQANAVAQSPGRNPDSSATGTATGGSEMLAGSVIPGEAGAVTGSGLRKAGQPAP